MTSLIFTEQFYYPDGWSGTQIPRDITVRLASLGYEVTVICGSDPYVSAGDGSGEDPRLSGVRIRRLPRLFGGDIHSKKFLRQLWFYLLVVPALAGQRRADVYVTQTNPPLLVPIVALVARIRRKPYVVIAQDLYPEIVEANGMIRANGVLSRLLRLLFRWAYVHSTRVVALGPTMAGRLVAKGVPMARIELIPNWATGRESVVRGDQNELRSLWGLNGKFVLVYSGNLGVAHDMETPILAVKEIATYRRDVRLVMIGNGSRLEQAQALVRQYRLEEYVLFRPLVSAEMLPQSLGLADLALVTLRPGFEGLVVPSKLLGYMARGIPAVYVGPDGDSQRLIANSHGGVCIKNGESGKLARLLGELAANPAKLAEMGASAKRYYDEELSRDRSLEKYVSLIRTVSAYSHEHAA